MLVDCSRLKIKDLENETAHGAVNSLMRLLSFMNTEGIPLKITTTATAGLAAMTSC